MTTTVVNLVGLHVGDPGSAGIANPAAGSIARPPVTINQADDGSPLALLGTDPAWSNAGVDERLTHISVWADASTFRYAMTLAAAQSWSSGNVFTLTLLGPQAYGEVAGGPPAAATLEAARSTWW